MQLYDAIIIDTETTDTTEDLEVAELAWRSFSFSEDPFIGGRSLFKISRPMSFGALATHHILPEDLAEATLSAEHALTVVPSARYWIGHNVDFDWRALGTPPVKRICTLAMCRTIWPKCDAHTLSAMMYFLEGVTPATRELVKMAHGAVADIGLCSRILYRIVKEAGISDIDELWQFSEDCRIPKVMAFGKHKGKAVADVDKGYANWYARQEDPDPYLILAFKRAGKL